MATIKPEPCTKYELGFSATHCYFIFNKHQPTALFWSGSVILFVANDRYCGAASHYSNDGPSFGCCDLKSFYQRPSHIAADVAEQPDQILIGNYWADVIRPTVRFCFHSVLSGHYCLTAKVCQQLSTVGQKYNLLIKPIALKLKNSFRTSCANGGD